MSWIHTSLCAPVLLLHSRVTYYWSEKADKRFRMVFLTVNNHWLHIQRTFDLCKWSRRVRARNYFVKFPLYSPRSNRSLYVWTYNYATMWWRKNTLTGRVERSSQRVIYRENIKQISSNNKNANENNTIQTTLKIPQWRKVYTHTHTHTHINTH